MLTLAKYSLGVGDRFAHQARAQLRACQLAVERGALVIPVWNKSNREHTIVGSQPASVRAAADAAVRAWAGRSPTTWMPTTSAWKRWMDSSLRSDFYTIDVADAIGRPARRRDAVTAFVNRHPELIGRLEIPGIDQPFRTARADVQRIAGKYLARGPGSGRASIATSPPPRARDASSPKSPWTRPTARRRRRNCWSSSPPSPTRRSPSRRSPRSSPAVSTRGWTTSATWPSSRRSFSDDLAVIAFAVAQYGLPGNLKLSVHSGSDKFSIYGPIRRCPGALRRRRACEDGRHDLAGGGDRAGGGGRRGPEPGQGDLRHGPGETATLCVRPMPR